MKGKTQNKKISKDKKFIYPIVEKIKDSKGISIELYGFNSQEYIHRERLTLEELLNFEYNQNFLYWIDISDFSPQQITEFSKKNSVHNLIYEDIISVGQRPRFSEVNTSIFVLSKMLFYKETLKTIEIEQLSILTYHNLLFTFQEESKRDNFEVVRQRIKNDQSKLRTTNFSLDYLMYLLLNEVVNNYFIVLDQFAEVIEDLEDIITTKTSEKTYEEITAVRKEIILVKRNIAPMREVINAMLKSDNPFFKEINHKYYKDLLENCIQSIELMDSYRDMVYGLQDLYINNVNLKMNEVMKTLAIITSFMAPATVIGGIFGMNFDNMPLVHHRWGFYLIVALMFIIPFLMIIWFKRRKWF